MRFRHLVVADWLVLRGFYNDEISVTSVPAFVFARLTASRYPTFLSARPNDDCNGVSVRLVAVILNSLFTRLEKGYWWDGDCHGLCDALSWLGMKATPALERGEERSERQSARLHMSLFSYM
jgi:hypothetical protein